MKNKLCVSSCISHKTACVGCCTACLAHAGCAWQVVFCMHCEVACLQMWASSKAAIKDSGADIIAQLTEAIDAPGRHGPTLFCGVCGPVFWAATMQTLCMWQVPC